MFLYIGDVFIDLYRGWCKVSFLILRISLVDRRIRLPVLYCRWAAVGGSSGDGYVVLGYNWL